MSYTIEHVETEQNWQEEATYHYFDVAATGEHNIQELEGGSEYTYCARHKADCEPALLDDEGYPINIDEKYAELWSLLLAKSEQLLSEK